MRNKCEKYDGSFENAIIVAIVNNESEKRRM